MLLVCQSRSISARGQSCTYSVRSIVIVLLLAAARPAPGNPSQAKERLERSVAPIEAAHSNALARLTEQYGSSLKAIQSRAEVSGNLELMAVLDTEIQKAAQGRTITLDKSAPAWLQQTQTKLQADRAGLAQKRVQGSGLRPALVPR